jgi:hypothetical protein
VDPGFGADYIHVPSSIDLIDVAYLWVRVGATNEWYVQRANSTNAHLPNPTIAAGTGRSGVNINGVLATKGTMGSLNENEWDFGDPDSLGYDTLVVRITGGVTPQFQSAGYVTINGSVLSGAGSNGGDIGATILYAYEDGVLTSNGLWDRTTGAWAYAGATVAGVNDVIGNSLFDVHDRLNVMSNGGKLPQSYLLDGFIWQTDDLSIVSYEHAAILPSELLVEETILRIQIGLHDQYQIGIPQKIYWLYTSSLDSPGTTIPFINIEISYDDFMTLEREYLSIPNVEGWNSYFMQFNEIRSTYRIRISDVARSDVLSIGLAEIDVVLSAEVTGKI